MADPENEDWVRVKPRDGSSVVQIAAGSSSENRASFRLNAACWPTACLDELHQLDASLSTQHLDLCFHFLAEPEKLDENACIRFPENVHWYGLFDAESNVLPTYKTGNSLDVRRKSAFEDCANTYPPSGQRFAANQVHVRLDDSPSLGPARPPPALTIPSQWLRGRSDELFTFYSVVSLKQFKTVHATERSDLRLELGDLSKFVQGSRWTMAGGQVSCKVIEAQPRAGNTESAHGGQIVVGEFVDSRGKPLVCFRTKEKMSKGTLVRFQPSAKVCVVHVVKNKLVYAYDITSTFRRTCCGGTLSESAEIAADTPYGQWNVVIFGDIEFFERIQNAAQNQSNALEELRIALRTHVEEITEAGTSDNVSLGSITASDVLSVLDAQANLNSKLAVAIGTTDFGLRNMVQSRSLLSLQAGLPIVDCTEDSWQEDGSADGGVCETEAAAQQYFRDCDRHDLQAKLSLVRHFKGRGGRVVFFGSDCVSNRPHAVLSESTASKPTFHLHPSDVVYPVCHEGQNRSQVMHLVMQSVMGMLGAAPENVQAPHGATGGFDPHSAYVDLTDDNFYGYIHGPIDPLLEPGLAKRKSEEEDWSHIAFWKAFGLAKTARIGARMAGITLRPLVNRKPPPVTGLALNPDMQTPDFDHELKRVGINRRLMRDMFERTIYSSESCAIARLHRYLNDGLEPSGDNGSGGMDVATKSANPNVVGTTPSKARHRRVFITFCRAAAVTMQRLLDSCPPFPETDDDPAALLAAASSLRDVVIIALPWSDPVANAGCAEHINARNDELKQAGAPPTATRMSLTVEIYHHLYSQFAQLFPVVAENILRSKTASLGSRLQQRAIRLRQRRRSSGADCGSRLTDSIQMNKAFIDRELERVQLNTAALESISCGDHANDDDDVCCTVPMKNIHLAFPSIFTSERFHANLSTGHYVSWRQCVETSVYANFKDHIKVLAHQLVALVVTLHQRGIVLGALSLDSLLFAPKDPTRLVYYAPNSPLRTVLSFQVQQAMPEGPLYLLYSQIGMRYSVSPRRSGDQMATADSVSVPRWFLCPHVDILALGNVLRETFSDAQLSAPLRDLIARMTEPDISKRVNAHEIFETHLDAFQAWSLKSKKFALPRSMYSVRQAVAEINELVNELSFDENELRKAQRREEIATKNRGGVMSGSAMKAWVSKQLKIKTKESTAIARVAVNKVMQLAAQVGLLTNELTKACSKRNRSSHAPRVDDFSRSGHISWTCRICRTETSLHEVKCDLCGAERYAPDAQHHQDNSNATASEAPPDESDASADAAHPLNHSTSVKLLLSVDRHLEATVEQLQQTVQVVSNESKTTHCLFLLKVALFKQQFAKEMLGIGMTDKALELFKSGHVWAQTLHLNCTASKESRHVFATQATDLLHSLHAEYTGICQCRWSDEVEPSEIDDSDDRPMMAEASGPLILSGERDKDSRTTRTLKPKGEWCSLCRNPPAYTQDPVDLTRSAVSRRPAPAASKALSGGLSRSAIF